MQQRYYNKLTYLAAREGGGALQFLCRWVGRGFLLSYIYMVRTCLMEIFDLVISFSLPLVRTHTYLRMKVLILLCLAAVALAGDKHDGYVIFFLLFTHSELGNVGHKHKHKAFKSFICGIHLWFLYFWGCQKIHFCVLQWLSMRIFLKVFFSSFCK